MSNKLNHHVSFLNISGFCERLECNADACNSFVALRERETEQEKEREGERDLRTWPLILSKERSQALKTRSTMIGSDSREKEKVQNGGV